LASRREFGVHGQKGFTSSTVLGFRIYLRGKGPSSRLSARRSWPTVAATGVQLSGLVTVAINDITILGTFTPETKPFENLTVAEVAARTGKHPVNAMLDVAVADYLRPVFYAEPANVNRDALHEIVGYQWIVPGVSDGGAHTRFFTGGRYPTEFLSRIVREEAKCSLEHAHWRLSALPAHCAASTTVASSPKARRRDLVVYHLERLECVPSEVGARLPGGRMAPHPARTRVSSRRGEGRGHDRRRPRDGEALRPAPSATARCNERGARRDAREHDVEHAVEVVRVDGFAGCG